MHCSVVCVDLLMPFDLCLTHKLLLIEYFIVDIHFWLVLSIVLGKPLARNGNFFKNAVINIFFTVTSKMTQLHIFAVFSLD